MSKLWPLLFVLIGIISACDKPKSVAQLTCKDSPVGRTKAEQMAIADACFLGGSFKKSSGKEW